MGMDGYMVLTQNDRREMVRSALLAAERTHFDAVLNKRGIDDALVARIDELQAQLRDLSPDNDTTGDEPSGVGGDALVTGG